MIKKKSKAIFYAKKVLFNPFLCLIALICSTTYYQWKMSQDYQLNQQTITQKKAYLESSNYKSKEMLRPVVRLETVMGAGSGVIIYKNINTYYVITNYHVIDLSLNRTLYVDGLRGISSYIDQNPDITVHCFHNDNAEPLCAKVIAESKRLDLALLSFESYEALDVARIAGVEVINSIDTFDTVYAVGCQLAIYPMPTQGIISRIINEQYFVGFNNSAQITPGSSGGGVFKLYKNHYYLIGISNKVAVNYYQIFSHYAYAISAKSIYKFLHDNNLDSILH